MSAPTVPQVPQWRPCAVLSLCLTTLFIIGRVDKSAGELHVYPLIVSVRVEVDEVRFVDDHAERIGLRMRLFSEWDDIHLRYGRTSGELQKQEQERRQQPFLSEQQDEFNPELLFVDIQGESPPQPPPQRFTQVTADGKVQQLSLAVSTFACPMLLSWLPVDVQTCTILLRSSTYDRHILFLSWDDDRPLAVPPAASGNHANFTTTAIEQSAEGDCLIEDADGREFYCMRINLSFTRNYRQYLGAYILPTALLATLCWLSLFVHYSPARALILLIGASGTGYLTYSTYVDLACPMCFKLLDVWTVACAITILYCFVESLIVQFAFKRAVTGHKRYSINDIRPNIADKASRIIIGALLSFVVMFYLTFMYVTTQGREQNVS